MTLETAPRTLHFDLSHLPAGTSLWLSAGARDVPLEPHTGPTRRAARDANRALALVPPERMTHYVRDLPLPTGAPQLLFVHSPAREGKRLPEIELTHVHLPRAARERAIARMRGHREHPAHARAHAKLAEAGIAAGAVDDGVLLDVHDWATAMDAAVSLVFFHLEMMSLDPDAAATVHLQIEYANGISDLAASILKQARAHAADPAVPSYVHEGAYRDPFTLQPTGEPAYLWTEETRSWAEGAILSSLRDTQNDPSLESTTERAGTWSVQTGTTAAGVGAQEGEAALARRRAREAGRAGTAGWSLVNLTAGHGLAVGAPAWDGETLTLRLRNDWLRWLSVYAQFQDAAGRPFDPPGWEPIAPGPNQGTKKYVGILSSADTILGIPLPADYTEVSIPVPAGAARVACFAGGLGRVNGIAGVGGWDTDVCVNGAVMTSIFNLGIPAIGLVAGFSVSAAEVNAIADDIFVSVVTELLLTFTESAAAGGLSLGEASMWISLADSLVSVAIDASPELAAWLAAKFTLATVKKAVPVLGWISTGVSIASNAAQLAQTTVAIVESPATFTLTAERKMDIDVTMLPDARHQDQWPATATHFRLAAQYAPASLLGGSSGFVYNAMYTGGGAPTPDFPLPATAGPIHLTIEGAPAGGRLSLVASFYSSTNWLCGHYQSEPMDALPDGTGVLVVPPFHITEELVPLDAETYYAPLKALAYTEGAHRWASVRFAIRDGVSLLAADLDAGTVTPALQAAFLRAGGVALAPTDTVLTTGTEGGSGDRWLITGAAACWHVALVHPSGAAPFLEVFQGSVGTVHSLSGSNLGHALGAVVGVTLNQDGLRLGYTWQASGQGLPLTAGGPPYPGQAFTFQDVSAGADPEAGLKFVPAAFPTRPLLVYDLYGAAGAGAYTFYIDPRDAQYHVRRVDLSRPGPFDLGTGESYGRFTQQIDAAAVHPNGYLVGINQRNAKIEVLPLLKVPVPDAEAPLANLYSGSGSRPGLVQNPAGVTVTAEGVVLVLENATPTSPARVQAMDYMANPVNAFGRGTRAQLPLRDEGGPVTHLDIAAEVGGHFYVLKYLGEGRTVADYRLDIHAPDGTWLSQTVAVNAGKLAVSLWREMFTLDFDAFEGPGGRTEPSVSQWIPSTPQGAPSPAASRAPEARP